MVLGWIIAGIAAVAVAVTVLYLALKGAEENADKNCPTTSVGDTKKECPLKKVFEAKIIEIIFKSHVKVCRNKKVVPKDFHWKEGVDVNDNIYSKRPAVYIIKSKGKSDDVIVKIQVTKSQNISGNGKLSSKLGAFAIEGQCPLNLGIHDVNAKIKDLPDSIQWYKGDAVWGLEIPDLNESRALNTTRVELFSVLDTPFKEIYQNKKGVWVEALRLLCDKADVLGVQTSQEAVKKIAEYCHGTGHGLKYDSEFGGDSSYGAHSSGSSSFKLADYLKGNNLTTNQQFANCADQAGALQALCGAVGVEIKWICHSPFGFIKATNLLGYGKCNNPFFKMNGTSQYIDPNKDPTSYSNRTSFGWHAFCCLEGTAAKKKGILDACVGPHVGNESDEDYAKASIDAKTTLDRKGFLPNKSYMHLRTGLEGVI